MMLTMNNEKAWVVGFIFIPPVVVLLIIIAGIIVSRTTTKYNASPPPPPLHNSQKNKQSLESAFIIKKKKNNKEIGTSLNIGAPAFINNDEIYIPFFNYSDEINDVVNNLQWLRAVMKIHGILDLLGGFLLFLWPESAFILFGFENNDNVVFLRLVAAALLAITYVSFNASILTIKPIMNNNKSSRYSINYDKKCIYYYIINRENITYLSAVLDFKIIWAGTVSLATIYYSLEKVFSTPQQLPIAWGTWLIMVVFITGFIVWILGKNNIKVVTRKLKKISSSLPSQPHYDQQKEKKTI